MATIGFIGLGNMGAPMAANLVKAQQHVTGYDIVAAARAALAANGGHEAASAADAAGARLADMACHARHLRIVERVYADLVVGAEDAERRRGAADLFGLCDRREGREQGKGEECGGELHEDPLEPSNITLLCR